MSLTEKFNKIVSDLKSADIHIHHFAILNPDPVSISKVESKLGYTLDPSIKEFYNECGGIQLIWNHRQNPNFDSHEKKFSSNNFPLDDHWATTDYFNFDGVIMIPSIDKVFLTDWFNHIYFDFTIENEDDVNFANRVYIEPDFSKRIKPFDWFSNYNDIAFFLDGTSNPPLILGDDHQACYTDSKLISFSNYLEFLYYSKGSIEARRTFFSKYHGYEYPLVTLQEIKNLPPLDLSKYNERGLEIPFERNYWSDDE